LLSLFITQNTAVWLQLSHQLAVSNGALGFIGLKEKRDRTYHYVMRSRFLTRKADNLGREVGNFIKLLAGNCSNHHVAFSLF
jgi:hypothetical protein